MQNNNFRFQNHFSQNLPPQLQPSHLLLPPFNQAPPVIFPPHMPPFMMPNYIASNMPLIPPLPVTMLVPAPSPIPTPPPPLPPLPPQHKAAHNFPSNQVNNLKNDSNQNQTAANLEQTKEPVSKAHKIERFHTIKNDRKLVELYFSSCKSSSSSFHSNPIVQIQTIDYNHGLSAPTVMTTTLLNNTISNNNNNNNNNNLDLRTSVQSLLDSADKKSLAKSTENDRTKTGPNPVIRLENILLKPHRDHRPHKIAILLRGPPGSGKSYLADLIKKEEEKNSSEKPKILSIDNYFMSDDESGNTTKYEFDKSMNETYQKSLIKSFKKALDDSLFSFLIVDMTNERMKQIDEMSLHAKQKGYNVYIIDLLEDNESFWNETFLFKRNKHNRSLEDIREILNAWEHLPSHYTKLDASYYLEEKKTENVIR